MIPINEPGQRQNGWIGVDLDATLAEYHGFTAPDDFGKPIAVMVARVRAWREDGIDVRIFTARGSVDQADQDLAYPAIQRWCQEHLGEVLPITTCKDIHMWQLWDDRCVQVRVNNGTPVCDLTDLSQFVRAINVANGWAVMMPDDWHNCDYRVPALLALIHSEVSEALEDFRNNRKEHFGEEIADVTGGTPGEMRHCINSCVVSIVAMR